MEVVICPNSERAEALVAEILFKRIQAKPDIVLGLATGRTMEKLYAKLVEYQLNYSEVSTFNLDEYIGLERIDPHSYWHYMHQHLFNHINIEIENIHMLDGSAKDLKQAARDFEWEIKAAGGIDIQLLGIGRSGHIGFNEPLSSFASRTREKTLTKTTLEQNASMFGGNLHAVPKRALTMGVGTILEARELILLVTGHEKAEILANAVEGPMSSVVSASAVQLHPNCKIIVDRDAAKQLENVEYYQSMFENDPDWEEYRAFGCA